MFDRGGCHHRRLVPCCISWEGYGNDFIIKTTGYQGFGGALLAAERKLILLLARHSKFLGQYFRRLTHGKVAQWIADLRQPRLQECRAKAQKCF